MATPIRKPDFGFLRIERICGHYYPAAGGKQFCFLPPPKLELISWGRAKMDNRLMLTGALLLTFLGGFLMTALIFRILLGPI